MAVNVFIRQPFTEAGQADQKLVQGVLNVLSSLSGDPVVLESLTGFEAQSEATFRQAFEKETDLAYTPANFRAKRLELLERADAFVFIRTGYTESGAFEVAYNIYKGPKAPIFFAVSKAAPMRETFLKDLEDLVPVTYCEFSDPEELRQPLQEYFSSIEKSLFLTPSIF